MTKLNRPDNKKTLKAFLTKTQIVAALDSCGGKISEAAKVLGVSFASFQKYYKKFNLSAKAHDEELLDLAESKLRERIEAGDIKAITYILDKRGQERGWSKDLDKTKADAVPITFVYKDCGGAPPEILIKRKSSTCNCIGKEENKPASSGQKINDAPPSEDKNEAGDISATEKSTSRTEKKNAETVHDVNASMGWNLVSEEKVFQ